MADEMRWNAMGCAGHAVVRTPNLDGMARSGARFLRAYSSAPVCSPARASLFTGRHPHVHGVTQNWFGANRGEVFLPSVLKHYGYDTAIAGKLHFEPRQESFGFDAFWSDCDAGPIRDASFMAYIERKYGKNEMFAIAKGSCPWPHDPLGRHIGKYAHPLEDFQTRWITDRSIEWLRTRKQTGPWFLFTSYVKPHKPYVEPEPYFSMYDPATIPVPRLPPDAAQIREAQSTPAQKKKYVDSEPMMRTLSALYFGAITHVDHEVGRLLAELEELGLSNDTLVVFTSDHGNMLGDRGRWFKGNMYEGSIRVPLVWRDPRRPQDGCVINEVVDSTGLFPSVLEALGLPIPEGVQGTSWVPLVNGARPAWNNRCFAELRGSMLLDDGWKFIEIDKPDEKRCELYDLSEDPLEQHDLANDPRHHDRVTHYTAELVAHRALKPEPIRIPGMSTPDYALQEPYRRPRHRRSALNGRRRA
jgi:arylsulfatase A-like enzyme